MEPRQKYYYKVLSLQEDGTLKSSCCGYKREDQGRAFGVTYKPDGSTRRHNRKLLTRSHGLCVFPTLEQARRLRDAVDSYPRRGVFVIYAVTVGRKRWEPKISETPFYRVYRGGRWVTPRQWYPTTIMVESLRLVEQLPNKEGGRV